MINWVKYGVLVLLFIGCSESMFSQSEYYENAYLEIEKMLEGKKPLSFKKAVYEVENAYHADTLDEKGFNQKIKSYVAIINGWIDQNYFQNYLYEDSSDFKKNAGIFQIMTDTIFIGSQKAHTLPFEYDFDDFFGEYDLTKHFVSKLMITHTGNCHSMPYLYRILAEEMETPAYLAFAPNHMYIKARSKDPKIGFYNTELTSKCFPVDAWVMTSGYVSVNQIVSGIYMDTLSLEQSVAINLIDLAEGYKRKDTLYHDFVIKCCDLAVKHYPNYANGLLLKAETMKEQFEVWMKNAGVKFPSEMFVYPDAKALFDEMEETYTKLVELDYRNVSKKTYLKWLEELANNLDKYNNQKITNFNHK
ncbi:hypothetical protein [Parvicella tangerina]|uniref:Uncharacterized protein n=1 Tax=Parvicella tangerina TaxID=2829795 RepID=A0A916NRV2_9FLAO|nr:hypothetical protein [Parvicella tangerina]CAG5082209.1 hypothetical protein CRYO30217_01841 [Parvicella tangerina]